VSFCFVGSSIWRIGGEAQFCRRTHGGVLAVAANGYLANGSMSHVQPLYYYFCL
jgi:hypothetical protein